MSGEMKAVTPPTTPAETTVVSPVVPLVTPVDPEGDKATKRVSVRDLPVHLTKDEKTQSQKSQAFVFDNLVSANLKLVKAIDQCVASIEKLVRISYVMLTTMLILVLIMLVIELTRPR